MSLWLQPEWPSGTLRANSVRKCAIPGKCTGLHISALGWHGRLKWSFWLRPEWHCWKYYWIFQRDWGFPISLIFPAYFPDCASGCAESGIPGNSRNPTNVEKCNKMTKSTKSKKMTKSGKSTNLRKHEKWRQPGRVCTEMGAPGLQILEVIGGPGDGQSWQLQEVIGISRLILMHGAQSSLRPRTWGLAGPVGTLSLLSFFRRVVNKFWSATTTC